VPVSAAAEARMRANWEAFKAQARSGPATIDFTEEEVTSRGVSYVEEKDMPVEGLQVYFCPDGHAEAYGKVSAGPLDSKVLVKGTLDLSGDRPRLAVDSVEAGNLPSALAKPVIDQVLDRSGARTLDLSVPLRTISYADGRTTITGGP
jgi:hypothetical protein